VRVLNCYSAVSVECRVAAVQLRVRDSFLPEVLLSGCRQTLWRLSVGPVACFSCQSSLAVAVGDFWRLWGCRLGGFGAVGDFWRIWGCRRGGFGAVVDLGGSRRLGCRGFGLSAISGGLGAVDVKDFVQLVNLKAAWCVVWLCDWFWCSCWDWACWACCVDLLFGWAAAWACLAWAWLFFGCCLSVWVAV
jgi:hypothetical protein